MGEIDVSDERMTAEERDAIAWAEGCCDHPGLVDVLSEDGVVSFKALLAAAKRALADRATREPAGNGGISEDSQFKLDQIDHLDDNALVTMSGGGDGVRWQIHAWATIGELRALLTREPARPSDDAISLLREACEWLTLPSSGVEERGLGARIKEFLDREPARPKPTSDGAARIVAERQRQIDAEGWTTEHDDEHDDGELAVAAGCYLEWAEAQATGRDPVSEVGRMPEWWPWEPRWWKPSDDPVRNLEKAGALIAAEIDRLLRERHGIAASEAREEKE